MFESIIGEQLSSVEFVQDYVQLRFDGPTLTAFVWPVLRFRTKAVHFGESSYRDELCGRIGHKVRAAELRQGEAVIVEFEDGAIISVSLRAEDSVGPEAGHFTNGSSPAEPILQF
jgi:hypothetical protein